MDNMIKYAKIHGVTWYICRDCGHKERVKREVCPLCGNKPGRRNPELEALLKIFEMEKSK